MKVAVHQTKGHTAGEVPSTNNQAPWSHARGLERLLCAEQAKGQLPQGHMSLEKHTLGGLNELSVT